jgi:hypothetical protein
MTKKRVIVLFIVVGVLAALAGWLSAEALAAKIKRDRLADGLGQVQLAVERYGFDHFGHYPVSLADVLADGTLDAMPENPYTKQPMPVLVPADAPVPGGVVYVAWGPRIAASEGVVRQENIDYIITAYGLAGQAGMEPPELEQSPAQAELASIKWNRVVQFKRCVPLYEGDEDPNRPNQPPTPWDERLHRGD